MLNRTNARYVDKVFTAPENIQLQNPLNDAYAKLQAVIPHVDRKPKIPKIKTLRCACKYIKILQEVPHIQRLSPKSSCLLQALNDGTTRCVDYYRDKSRTVIESEVQSRNNYKVQAH